MVGFKAHFCRGWPLTSAADLHQINLLSTFDVFSITLHTVEIPLHHEYGLVLTRQSYSDCPRFDY
jgi:hypothetical protein